MATVVAMPSGAEPRLSPALRWAVRHALGEAGVVACPTEAVWGLSCDAYNETALKTLLRLKRRDAAKGLIVVAASFDQLGDLISQVDGSLRFQVLKEGKTARGRMGEVREYWREHCGLS